MIKPTKFYYNKLNVNKINGEIKLLVDDLEIESKLEVQVQDIKGIHYYIDNNGNVYNTEDIINNLKNPKIIASYSKNEKGEFIIPEFNLL
jgi:hypothetical protein